MFKENLNYLTAVLSNITNTNNSPLLKFAYVLPDHIVYNSPLLKFTFVLPDHIVFDGMIGFMFK